MWALLYPYRKALQPQNTRDRSKLEQVIILQYVTSATLVQSSKSAYYLVIPLTQEF